MVQIVHMLWHFLEEIWQIQSDPSGVQWKPVCLLEVCVSHFSGSIGAELEAAADHIKEESHQTVEHSCSRQKRRAVPVRTM